MIKMENNNDIKSTHTHISYESFKKYYFDRYVQFKDNRDDNEQLSRKFYGLYLLTTDSDLDIKEFVKDLLDRWMSILKKTKI